MYLTFEDKQRHEVGYKGTTFQELLKWSTTSVVEMNWHYAIVLCIS